MIAVAVVVVLVVTAVHVLDGASWIHDYRVVDDQTLVVGTLTGPGAWTRVTRVGESQATVTISVGSLLIQPTLLADPVPAPPHGWAR